MCIPIEANTMNSVNLDVLTWQTLQLERYSLVATNLD